MQRNKLFTYVMLGFLGGLLAQELIRPSRAVGDGTQHLYRTQEMLLDYEEQRAKFGTTGPGAEAILDAQIAVQGDVVFVIQNGHVYRSTSNGDSGTWEIVLN